MIVQTASLGKSIASRWRGALLAVFASGFLRSVAVVAGGTALAQLVHLASMPVVTRLYGPQAYGVFNLFVSMVVVVSNVATLSYAVAIVLPRRDAVAYWLLKASVASAVAVSAISGIVLMLFRERIAASFDLGGAATLLLWLAPFAIFLNAMVQCAEQWQLRGENFKSLSVAAVTEAAFQAAGRVGCGIIAPSALALGLLAVVAQALRSVVLFGAARRTLAGARTRRARPAASRIAAWRYRDFPLFRAPRALLHVVSASAPLLILGSLFGPKAAAFYAIAHAVLLTPVNLIANSVGKVFLQRLASRMHARQPMRRVVLRTTCGMALVGLPAFGAIAIGGSGLFALVFGPEWHEAGDYARWLAVLVFCNFFNVPAVQSLAVTNSQAALLGWEVATTGGKLGLLVAVGLLTGSAQSCVAAYAVFGALAGLCLTALALKRAAMADVRARNA